MVARITKAQLAKIWTKADELGMTEGQVPKQAKDGRYPERQGAPGV